MKLISGKRGGGDRTYNAQLGRPIRALVDGSQAAAMEHSGVAPNAFGSAHNGLLPGTKGYLKLFIGLADGYHDRRNEIRVPGLPFGFAWF